METLGLRTAADGEGAGFAAGFWDGEGMGLKQVKKS